MVTALFKIDFTGGAAGVSDTSRNDGVPNQLVTLTYTGTGATTYAWSFIDYQGAFTVPTLSGATSSVATFTPGGGAAGYGQSFEINLSVNSGAASATRIYRIASQRQGVLYPVYAENADPTASIANSGAGFIASSMDNSASNYRGWATNFYTLLAQYENAMGRMVVMPSPFTATGNVETWIGSVYLPVCTLNSVHAYLGSQATTDTTTLRMYRSSDSSLVTTLTTISAPQDVSVTSIPISQAGWYEFHMLGSLTTSVTYCRGIFLDYKC